MAEQIAVVTLPGDRYLAVARLVTAGIGARFDLSFEAVDDLQLAVELVLAGACSSDTNVTIAFETDGDDLRIAIAPVDTSALGEPRDSDEAALRLPLRVLLERLVDDVSTRAEPRSALVLRKVLAVPRT